MKFHVTCCPGRTPVVTGGIQVWDEKREGQFPTYIRALRKALQDCNGPITIIEDDTELVPGWTDYVEHFYPWIGKTNQVVQWWWNGRMWKEPWKEGRPKYEQAFVHRPSGKFTSLQAVTYSRAIGFLLLAELEHRLADQQPNEQGQRHSGDYHIGRVLYDQRQDFLIHWPPIAQHVGENSMVAPGITLHDGFRTNPYYSRNTAEFIVRQLRPTPVVVYPGEYDER